MSRASKLFGNFSEVTFTDTTPILRQPDTSGANYLQHYSMKARRRKVGNYSAQGCAEIHVALLSQEISCKVGNYSAQGCAEEDALRGRRQGWPATPAPRPGGTQRVPGPLEPRFDAFVCQAPGACAYGQI